MEPAITPAPAACDILGFEECTKATPSRNDSATEYAARLHINARPAPESWLDAFLFYAGRESSARHARHPGACWTPVADGPVFRYGWHQEIALHCLRLIVSGTFDRFPGLQIVVGHMGEGLPFWYWRVGEDLNRIARDRLHKPVQRYFHDNLWITTSAFFRDELLALALATFGEDRIMFSVDYPMASARTGANWIRAVDLPRAVKEKIAHANARRLLGIAPA